MEPHDAVGTGQLVRAVRVPGDPVDLPLVFLFGVFEEHGGLDGEFFDVVVRHFALEVLFEHVDLVVHLDDVFDVLAHAAARLCEDVLPFDRFLQSLLDVPLSRLVFRDVHLQRPPALVVEHLLRVHVDPLGVHLRHSRLRCSRSSPGCCSKS